MTDMTLTSRTSIDALIQELHQFHAQEVYAGLGPAITRKKPLFRIVFGAVRLMSRSRLLNMVMVMGVAMAYRIFRRPSNDARIFQYGLSANNLASFKRLSGCLPSRVQDETSTNQLSFPLKARLTAALSLKRVWRIGGALKQHRHPRPLTHLQTLIGCSTLLLVSREPFPPKLEVVTVAADHAPICQALLFVARRQGRKTCYIQHAPVTDHFPPLNYDLAVLFDRASERAYERAAERLGVVTDTPVVILPPFEEEFQRPRIGTAPYCVGVCLSFLPDMKGLQKLIHALTMRPDVNSILMRRHPRCRQDWTAFAKLPKVELRPQNEAATEFFAIIDTALVPNSGVAIEALHHRRPTFYAPGTDAVPEDYYGFVASRLIPVFSDQPLSEAAAFFDTEWLDRFAFHDETITSSLPELRAATGRAFMQLLSEPSR